MKKQKFKEIKGTDKRPKGFDGILQAFGPVELQACPQIVSVIRRNNLKFSDFESWLIKKIKKMNLQDTRSIMKKIEDQIERNQISWEEIQRAIKQIKRERRKQFIVRLCPECKQAVEIHEINNEPDMMYGDKKFKTWWVCPNPNCNWEELSEKQPIDELKPYMVS